MGCDIAVVFLEFNKYFPAFAVKAPISGKCPI